MRGDEGERLVGVGEWKGGGIMMVFAGEEDEGEKNGRGKTEGYGRNAKPSSIDSLYHTPGRNQ